MEKIYHVDASKSGWSSIFGRLVPADSFHWQGCIVLEKYPASAQTRNIKKFLKNQFKESKKSIIVKQWFPGSKYYNFEISFNNESDEALFILNFKNLEGAFI